MIIISPFVLGYLLISSIKLRKKFPANAIDILKHEIANVSFVWKGKIMYAWFWSAGVHVPNASATIPGLILINAEWASRIVWNQDNPHMHDAFALAVCHEITHQERDFYYFDFFSPDGKFVNWVDEVHADFGGTSRGLDSDRNKAVFAMKYKLSCKTKKDKDTRSHPSWIKRIDYITNYNFNSDLIDKIASDCGCNNDKLVSEVKKFFEIIELRGRPSENYQVKK